MRSGEGLQTEESKGRGGGGGGWMGGEEECRHRRGSGWEG